MDLMRSVSTVALAVGASIAAGAFSAAQALPFSVSTLVNAPSGDQDDDSDTLTFSKFDPALGTLTGVVFTLTGESNATNVQVSGTFFSGEGGNATASVNSTFSISGPGPITLFSGSDDAQAFCSGQSNCSTPPIDSGSPAAFPPTSTVSGVGDLPNFIGLGGFFDVFVELDLTGGIDACDDLFNEPSCAFEGRAQWNGTLTVEFRFEPNVDPEPVSAPATLGLLAASLIGLGAAKRRWLA